MKTIIFDLDGVLIDNEQHSRNLWYLAEGIIGIFGITDKLWSKCLGTTAAYERDQFIKAYDEDTYDKFFTAVDYLKTKHPKPLKREGVEGMLSYLLSQNVRFGIASSSSQINVYKKLSENNLKEYFKYFITGDKVTKSKPHPEAFLKCAELMWEMPENCIVVEDSMNGVLAANSAGMKVVYYEDTDNAEGYTWKVNSMNELTNLFKEIIHD